ncbi:hypothetical protein G6F57_018043 [Rhizopus arrhizus]|nr:hypothetical protein G6F57_018043 [Rhizopus arrhizus]
MPLDRADETAVLALAGAGHGQDGPAQLRPPRPARLHLRRRQGQIEFQIARDDGRGGPRLRQPACVFGSLCQHQVQAGQRFAHHAAHPARLAQRRGREPGADQRHRHARAPGRRQQVGPDLAFDQQAAPGAIAIHEATRRTGKVVGQPRLAQLSASNGLGKQALALGAAGRGHVGQQHGQAAVKQRLQQWLGGAGLAQADGMHPHGRRPGQKRHGVGCRWRRRCGMAKPFRREDSPFAAGAPGPTGHPQPDQR